MSTWEDAVLLDDEQEQILIQLVELTRSIPREERDAFILVQNSGGAELIHHALREGLRVLMPDMHVLAGEGLISMKSGSQRFSHQVFVTPRGFRYYEHRRRRAEKAAGQLEDAVRDLLASSEFPHRAAAQAWARAMSRLWKADYPAALREVALACREAMQQFAASLIEQTGVQWPDPDPQKVKKRLHAVVDHVQPRLGGTVANLLRAAIEYWDALIPWVQARAHPRVSPATWEATRRAVFHTGFVMYELHRLIGRRD